MCCKKKMVIIAGNCFPVGDANGNLIIQCANYLKEIYDIKIICIREEFKDIIGEKRQEFQVYTLGQLRLSLAEVSEKKYKECNKAANKSIWLLTNFFFRGLGKIESLFFTIDNRWWYQKKAYKLLEKIYDLEKIDSVLSLNDPIEAHIAAYKFKQKHNEVKWISYWADLYACKVNKLNLFVSLKRLMKLERKLLSASDEIMSTVEVKRTLKKRYPDIENKIMDIPYTIRKLNIVKSEKHKQNNNIDFIYAGTFYKDIRNPEFLLKVFMELPSNYRLHLFAAGNCQNIIDFYKKKMKDRLIEHAQLPLNDLTKYILNEGDFLINIENNISTSNPSKLYDLLSYNKPIIDFCYFSSQREALGKFPAAISIMINSDIEQTVLSIKKFVDSTRCYDVDTFSKNIELYFKDNLENNIRKKVIEVCK